MGLSYRRECLYDAVAVCVLQIDTLPNLLTGGQHNQLTAADSGGRTRHYVRRHSTADGKDRWPYSDLLRHQLRQHDIIRLNRRPSSPRRYELWSNESKQREIPIPHLCDESTDDNSFVEQVESGSPLVVNEIAVNSFNWDDNLASTIISTSYKQLY